MDESMISATTDEANTKKYLGGLRLHSRLQRSPFLRVGFCLLLTVLYRLCLYLFLTNLEIPIVSTSLVGITNDLQGFSRSRWMVTAYLLTYVG